MKKIIFAFQGNLELTEKVVNNLAKRMDDKKVITLISQHTKEPSTGYITECWVDLDNKNDRGMVTVAMEVEANESN